MKINTEKHEDMVIQDTQETPISLTDGNPKLNLQPDKPVLVPLLQPRPAGDENNENEFADFAESAKLQTPDQDDPETDYLKLTPIIPDNIYDDLPEILKSGSSVFSDNRERDVFLTGALSIISGCLPGVKGVYAQQTTYPNLFSFIVAPAASGKGALRFSKNLAVKIHERALKESKEAEEVYQVEMERYQDDRHSRRRNSCEISNRPIQPPNKVLLIPANASYAKILWHLEQNNGTGIICETEADTMANVLKQEWGSYSDMLRKAFHHESLSSSKKINNEYLEVNNPRLSVALSGTPSQVLSLISSSEDGLFSRLIFYAYNVKAYWKDVSPGNEGINLNDYFEQFSFDVLRQYDFSERNPSVMELTQNQWEFLNAICKGWLDRSVIFNGNEAASIVKRVGIILYRIAMILTAMRKYEQNDRSNKIICSDENFETACRLSKVYLDHSIFMFNNLPKKDKLAIFNGQNNKKRLYDDLPDVFKRSEAVSLGEKYGIAKRTVDNLLKKLSGKLLKLESFGQYSKIIDKENNVTN